MCAWLIKIRTVKPFIRLLHRGWLGSGLLWNRPSSFLSSLIREHNNYFSTSADKPGIMALLKYRSQRVSTLADIIQNEHNESMNIQFWIISCPHLNAWQMKDHLTNTKGRMSNIHKAYILPSPFPVLMYNSAFCCSQIVSWMQSCLPY